MKRLLCSFGFALNGIRLCLATGINVKIHFLIALLTIGAGFVFSISITKWLVIFCCIALVVSMELINTAIEKLCNIVHPHHHPSIGEVKDIAAGAVLFSAFTAACCGAVIFIPEFISLFK
jgi:diacylglycerol kinase